MADPILDHIDHGTESWDTVLNDNMDKIDDNFVRSTKSADHGEKTYFDHEETLSGVLAGAAVTLAGAVPAGVLLMGVTTIVETAIPGPTTDFDIGDGTTVDLYGTAVATAGGTQTDYEDHDATFAPKLYPTAGDIVLTANGGNFAGGKVRVIAHYIKITPPTS